MGQAIGQHGISIGWRCALLSRFIDHANDDDLMDSGSARGCELCALVWKHVLEKRRFLCRCSKEGRCPKKSINQNNTVVFRLSSVRPNGAVGTEELTVCI